VTAQEVRSARRGSEVSAIFFGAVAPIWLAALPPGAREPARHRASTSLTRVCALLLRLCREQQTSWQPISFPHFHATRTTTIEREKQFCQPFPTFKMPTQSITPSAPRNISPKIYDAVFDRSLNFRIELPFLDALEFISQIGQYNNFQAETVIDSLERVDRLIPRASYGPENPNNGQRNFKISIGREGSPVVYIDRHEFSLNENWLDEPTMKAICREMELCALADESDYTVHDLLGFGGRRIEFRFWWD
jgi:hypothetical protein